MSRKSGVISISFVASLIGISCTATKADFRDAFLDGGSVSTGNATDIVDPQGLCKRACEKMAVANCPRQEKCESYCAQTITGAGDCGLHAQQIFACAATTTTANQFTCDANGDPKLAKGCKRERDLLLECKSRTNPIPGCPNRADVTLVDLDKKFGVFRAASGRDSRCGPNELAAIANDMAGVQHGKWSNALSDVFGGCLECVLSLNIDPAWGPIVKITKSLDDSFINLGACYSVIAGPECGRAVQAHHLCVYDACTQCETNEDFRDCTDIMMLESSNCRSYDSAWKVACAEKRLEADAKCSDIQSGIAYLCGPDT